LELPAIPQTKKEIDVTAIDDTVAQFITDPLLEFGTFDLLVAFDKDNTQHMALLAAFEAASAVAGQLTMGDGEILTGSFLPLTWAYAGGRAKPVSAESHSDRQEQWLGRNNMLPSTAPIVEISLGGRRGSCTSASALGTLSTSIRYEPRRFPSFSLSYRRKHRQNGFWLASRHISHW